MNTPLHAIAAQTAFVTIVAAGITLPGLAGNNFARAESSGTSAVPSAKTAGLKKKSGASTKVRPACKPSKSVLGVSRTITIDASKGPKYGYVNYPGKSLLKDKEVLLTFDDGPLPRYTNKVLEALERECTRATFFVVGRMAMAFPRTVKRIMNEGHTLGTHTWSHGNLQRHNSLAAMAQIDRGVAASEAAAGRKIAPVFRFPYLGRTKSMEAHLAKRGLAVFSIDVDSRDTRGYSPSRMISHTIARLKSRGKGIVLFHDIKSTTAAATAPFLRALRKNGFKIVHLKTSSYSAPVASLKNRYDGILEKRSAKKKKKASSAPRNVTALPVRAKRRKIFKSGAATRKPVINPTRNLAKSKTASIKSNKTTAATSKPSTSTTLSASASKASDESNAKPLAITPRDPFAANQ